MSCYTPVSAYRGVHSGIPGVEFRRSRRYAEPVDLPCGQCVGCRLERARQWAVRCVHEAQLHERNVFVTLTYDEAHLPCPPSLVKEDFRKFMKRLRKWAGVPVRYFQCGEYGAALRRPHYHALLFGVDFSDKQPFGKGVYVSRLLQRLWPFGFSTTGEVNFASASYVAGYVVKKVNGDAAAAHYTTVDADGQVLTLEPEYVSMSLKPGLGAVWLKRFWSDVYPGGEVLMRGCRPRQAPRYYDKLAAVEDPRMVARVKRARGRLARIYEADQTPERLEVRRKVAEAQLRLRKRSLEGQ